MDILHTAHQYNKQRYNVIPIATDGTKQPIGSWKPYQTRQATEHELQQWFGSQQPCGIGIVCGPISSNLVVIDFDHQAEQTYPQWLAQVQQQLPDVAQRLFIVQTPRPGYHVWIQSETEPPAGQVLAWTDPQPQLDSTGQPALDADGSPKLQPEVLIELRSTGHYVIAPGSPAAVHPTGKPYRVLQGTVSAVPVLSAEQVQQLLAIARTFTRYQPQHVQRQPGQQYRGEPRPGDIYNQHTDLRQLLLQHGWQLHHSVDDVDHLTRPGKPATAGTSATLGALRSDDGQPLLYVFSSAAAPFQAGCTYDAFAAFTMLEHNGDFSTAAAAVRIRYATQVQAAQKQWALEHQPPAEKYVPFPVHLLPDAVQTYVAEHAAAIGIDAAFVAVPMLPVLAALIGQSRSLFIKRNWTEPSILWAATVADVSTGKSPGWQAATAPAKELERRIHEQHRLAQQQYQQALQEFQADRTQIKPTKPAMHTQLTVDDVSMESLVDIHSHNWHGLLLSCDELAGWLRSFDQYRAGKGRDVENWLSIYNGSKCQVNRKTDGYRIYLPSTAVSVCGTIQPEVARATLFSERFVANGFAARILSAMPPAQVVRWTDNEVPEHVDTAMHKLAQQLYALPGEQGQERSIYLPFDDAAQQLFKQYLNDTADHAEQLEPALRNAWLKLRPAAARFALVFSVVQQVQRGQHGMQPVDLHSTQAGIELAMWFGRELERNYSNGLGVAADPAENHLAWILRTHPEGIDVRQLQQGRRNIQTAEQARQVLQQLLDAGKGRLEGQLFIPN
jgi:hypothetical protein